MPTAKAVLFDYGLVLSGPPDPAAWEWLKRILHADEAAFADAYWKHRHDYDSGILNHDNYWRAVGGDLGHTLNDQELHDLVTADTDLWSAPNQPMIDWAAHLQAAGIKTGILSNIGDAMEAGILARCAWLAEFSHHTFSHRLLIAKPDPMIYKHAAEGLAEAPEDILFIDDREENIAAARTAGMRAVQYSTHEAFVKSMRDEGLGSLLNV